MFARLPQPAIHSGPTHAHTSETLHVSNPEKDRESDKAQIGKKMPQSSCQKNVVGRATMSKPGVSELIRRIEGRARPVRLARTRRIFVAAVAHGPSLKGDKFLVSSGKRASCGFALAGSRSKPPLTHRAIGMPIFAREIRVPGRSARLPRSLQHTNTHTLAIY